MILIYPVCKCDSRGRQINQLTKINWCWLEFSPCKLLDGRKTTSDSRWVRCEKEGAKNIDCPGNNIFSNRKIANCNRYTMSFNLAYSAISHLKTF